MNIQLPKPFFFEEQSEYAVLLLHGFTGNSSDVRQLGRYLQRKGITSMAPHYEGHAEPPEKLIESSPHIWWKQVLDAYDELESKGYEKIFVAGISLGGIFALRLAKERNPMGIATICSPMIAKEKSVLFEKLLTYAKTFKKLEGKDEGAISHELNAFHPTSMLDDLIEFIQSAREDLEAVYVPTFIAQGKKDEVIDIDSANIIYKNISAELKKLQWYENSGHVLTIDQDKQQLFKDLSIFINDINM